METDCGNWKLTSTDMVSTSSVTLSYLYNQVVRLKSEHKKYLFRKRKISNLSFLHRYNRGRISRESVFESEILVLDKFTPALK